MATVIDGSAGVTTNAGGSVNPSTNVEGINYSCRAWVNFNGTGTVAIRGSGNVTSITDNGTGDYTINFTTAMVDVNYCIAGAAGSATTTLANVGQPFGSTPPATGSVKVSVVFANGSVFDAPTINVAVFR